MHEYAPEYATYEYFSSAATFVMVPFNLMCQYGIIGNLLVREG
ncbi:putative membrane protein [Anaplasma phagocytophilum str. ApNP]|uniref:Putative membrane protein n=1 Tax=Anaplasma phagocytophilum str. ApNP TaxID=1359153 RepID=A0A0F3NEX8_ANAPH|nr:putative membrane protein [Anaplasma phagocytophilum str. ApNP]